MKMPVVLTVDAEAPAFAPLFEALRAAGLRFGWLELAAPSPIPESLAAASTRGALRAVAVGGGKSVAVKTLKGEPVLRDLLREQFAGCDVVFLRGGELYPRLAPESGSFRYERAPESRIERLDATAVAARCRRPALRWKEVARA